MQRLKVAWNWPLDKQLNLKLSFANMFHSLQGRFCLSINFNRSSLSFESVSIKNTVLRYQIVAIVRVVFFLAISFHWQLCFSFCWSPLPQSIGQILFIVAEPREYYGRKVFFCFADLFPLSCSFEQYQVCTEIWYSAVKTKGLCFS